jgi:hypothetical protein
MRKAIVLAVIATSALVAQGRGPRQTARRSCINMAQIRVVEGAVTAVRLAYAAQYPTIQIAGLPIKIAPAWFFLERDFELRVGDRLRVEAAPCAGDAYLHAVHITNNETNARLDLRDSSGQPLWSAPRGAGGPRSGAPSSCIDTASAVVVSGVIESASYGVGVEMPSVVIRTDGSELLTVKLGPERVLLEHDIELIPGQAISARVAHSACRDEYIALELTTADGATIVLRNEDGTPAWD